MLVRLFAVHPLKMEMRIPSGLGNLSRFFLRSFSKGEKSSGRNCEPMAIACPEWSTGDYER